MALSEGEGVAARALVVSLPILILLSNGSVFKYYSFIYYTHSQMSLYPGYSHKLALILASKENPA